MSDDELGLSNWEHHLQEFTPSSQFPLSFVKSFAGGWPQLNHCTSWFYYQENCIRIQTHFRFLSPAPNKRPGSKTFVAGVRCRRFCDSMSLPKNHSLGRLALEEGRFSIALSTKLLSPTSPFVIVTLKDDRDARFRYIPMRPEDWQSAMLTPCALYNGVAVFQLAVNFNITRWYGEWMRTLGYLNAVLKIQVNCLLPAH